jgi:hypothetical protein
LSGGGIVVFSGGGATVFVASLDVLAAFVPASVVSPVLQAAVKVVRAKTRAANFHGRAVIRVSRS